MPDPYRKYEPNSFHMTVIAGLCLLAFLILLNR